MTDQNVHPDADGFGGWSWREPVRGEHFRRCSYCGSIHPDDLAAETGWVANWADRKYGWPHKFYVDILNRQPDALFVVSTRYDNGQPTGGAWIARADLTAEQLAVVERDGYLTGDRQPSHFEFRTRVAHFGKFYSIHLSDGDLDQTVKQSIEQRCGFAFDFTADRSVKWRRP